jgi:hypothetical protein
VRLCWNMGLRTDYCNGPNPACNRLALPLRPSVPSPADAGSARLNTTVGRFPKAQLRSEFSTEGNR